MTAQMPDVLESLHRGCDLAGLALYGVACGDPTTNHGWGEPYVFQRQPRPPADAATCTALWRGYVASFRLYPDGRLALVRYTYPSFDPHGAPDHVETLHEELTGDFWLVLKADFCGPRTYVPFVAGRVVVDRRRWLVELRDDEDDVRAWLESV